MLTCLAVASVYIQCLSYIPYYNPPRPVVVSIIYATFPLLTYILVNCHSKKYIGMDGNNAVGHLPLIRHLGSREDMLSLTLSFCPEERSAISSKISLKRTTSVLDAAYTHF